MAKSVVRIAVIVLGFCFCGIVFFVTGLLFSEVSTHNQQLDEYATQFQSIMHPANTEFVASKQVVSLMVGNGNHCDYFVGEVRAYDGQKTEIESFYANQEIAGRALTIAFYESDGFQEPNLQTMPTEFYDPKSWHISPSESSKTLYAVSILIIGSEAGLDYPCW